MIFNSLLATIALFVIGGFGSVGLVQDETITVQPEFLPPRSQEAILEIVEKDTAFAYADSISDLDCADFLCYGNYYKGLTQQQDIQATFADLKVRYDESSLVRSMCHQLVHVIGRTATVKYPDVTEAYRRGDHFCWSGYYHGVMEGILKETSPENLPVIINSICDNIPGEETYSFDYYNCVHGLGHGVMYVASSELFDALEMCDNLTGEWERKSCYGGVFMENVITDFENHFTEYLKPEDPLYPCNAVNEQYKRACYMMQTSYALRVIGYDFSKMFELCSQVEDFYQNTCYQSIGRDASGLTVSDIDRTKSYCLLGDGFRQQSYCTIGAVKDFISYFHSDVQAKQLCESLSVDLRETCFNTAVSYYQSFD